MNISLHTTFNKFLLWRIKNISNKNFILILSIIIGILAGIATAILKNIVHFIRTTLTKGFSLEYGNYLYIIYPAIGITLTVIFLKFILRKRPAGGIPGVLYAISRKSGKLPFHHLYSSIVASSLTVGFGGSVGLEGPIVATGAGIGSSVARLFRLNYKQTIILIGAASTAAIAAIFKAPITGIVFALEIMMLDMNLTTLTALLLSSITAVLTSYLLLGKDVVYSIHVPFVFQYKMVPEYILLGIFAAIISLYYFNVYVTIHEFFDKIKKWYYKLPVGSIILGLLIMLFPALYGEGYESLNELLHNNYTYLFDQTFYYSLSNNFNVIIAIFFLIVLLKVIAMTVTLTAGGVGGDFAPTLFIGAHLGFGFAIAMNHFFGTTYNPVIFALLGMAAMIAGVLHGPLTSIFLIAEITNSYELFIPLMIVSTVSFFIVRIFYKYSIYTYKLAKRGDLITHDKDKSALQLLEIEKLLETNFRTVKKEYTLGQLVKEIEQSSRNLFPVLDDEGNLEGVVQITDIRNIMFKPEFYDKVTVKDVMLKLNDTEIVDIEKDSMEDVVNKFNKTGHYNLPVVKNGKYLGFLSRANVLTSYRKLINLFSGE